MSSLVPQLSRYYRTLRTLRKRQLLWQVYRRLRPVSNPAGVGPERARPLRLQASFCHSPQPSVAEFRFLSQSASADPAKLKWQAPGKSRLWRYNLHYFDYLLWEVLPTDWKDAYIADWIESNPVGTATAWEPYTVSLRVVNWMKYFATRPGEVPQHWQHSLVNQLHWLTYNLEHHILANHFLKNAKALLLGGLWFAGANGKRFLQLGEHYFVRELREQILSDGGHFERSPMYHSIVVEDCLDVLNFAQAERERLHPNSLLEISEASQRALRFLEDITGADGRIPLFNDSAFGIAPPPAALLAYGDAVVGYKPCCTVPNGELHCILRPATGYFGYRTDRDSMLIDCGPIGPDYQPGHAHCDTLSFELCLDGQRVIVDPGIHGYDDDPTRAYLRSTAAHNTVTFNGAEQSEVWGVFRVGRRAQPIGASLSEPASGQLEFRGGHDGFRWLDNPALHHRRIEIDAAGRWRVCDVVEGRGSGELLSYLHLAPDIAARVVGDGHVTLLRAGRRVAELRVPNGVVVRVQSSYVAQHFGQREVADVVVMSRSGPLPLDCSYELERASG